MGKKQSCKSCYLFIDLELLPPPESGPKPCPRWDVRNRHGRLTGLTSLSGTCAWNNLGSDPGKWHCAENENYQRGCTSASGAATAPAGCIWTPGKVISEYMV